MPMPFLPISHGIPISHGHAFTAASVGSGGVALFPGAFHLPDKMFQLMRPKHPETPAILVGPSNTQPSNAPINQGPPPSSQSNTQPSNAQINQGPPPAPQNGSIDQNAIKQTINEHLAPSGIHLSMTSAEAVAALTEATEAAVEREEVLALEQAVLGVMAYTAALHHVQTLVGAAAFNAIQAINTPTTPGESVQAITTSSDTEEVWVD